MSILRIRSNRALVAALTGLLTFAVAEVPANRAEACSVKLDIPRPARPRMKRVIAARAAPRRVIDAQPRQPLIRTSRTQPRSQVAAMAPVKSEPTAPLVVETMPTTPAIEVARLREELFFGPNSSELDYARLLTDSAKWLTAHPDIAITIEGHADPSGTPQGNLAISKSRAESVKAWLVAHGVEGTRIETRAFGDTKLKYGENDGRNRRVSIGLKRP